jgi:hypothetical protein
VVDLRELVKGSATPRGVNRIVVLSPALKPVRSIEYTRERPLFCLGNQLFLWADLTIENAGQEGNVLTFTHQGRDVSVRHVEPNDFPVPPTKDRNEAIQ